MIALIVTLEVYPERMDQFLAAIRENAERSLKDEPGCKRYDVIRDKQVPTHFFIYELYDDEAAVAAHRVAPHFLKWREHAAVCVVQGSQVNTLCEPLFQQA
jgi:quinol monooxygenase YgiN